MPYHICKQFVSKDGSSSETSNSDLDLESFQSSASWLHDEEGSVGKTTSSSNLVQPCCYLHFRRGVNHAFDHGTNQEGQIRPPLIGHSDDCKSCLLILAQNDGVFSSSPYGGSQNTLPVVLQKSTSDSVVPSRFFSSTKTTLSKTENITKTDCVVTKFNVESLPNVTDASTMFLPSGWAPEEFSESGNYGWALSNEEGGSRLFSSTEFADVKLDMAERRAPSPSVQSVSSVASTQRLEWDSGADIGYGGSKSANNLSTLERLAIGTYCSAFKQIEGDSALCQKDENALMMATVEDHCIMPADPERRDAGNIVGLDGENIEKSSIRKQVSTLEPSGDAESHILEYQRQLELKEYEEDCSLLPENCPAESESFSWKSDISTRIMALKIKEKRSCSMTDLSDAYGRKNCYLNNLKRINSYSVSDMSPAAKPAMASESVSSTCSMVSLNSSNTVVGVALQPNINAVPAAAPLDSDSGNQCRSHLAQSAALQSWSTRVTMAPKMSSGVRSSSIPQVNDNGIQPTVPATGGQISYEEAGTCKTEVAQYVKSFLNQLCLNSETARRQRLLQKILGDLGIPMHTNENGDKIEARNMELLNKSTSPHGTCKRNLSDSMPVTQHKLFSPPKCDVVFYSPIDDNSADDDDDDDFKAAIQVEQRSSTGNGNPDVSLLTTGSPYFSSSEKGSTFWKEVQQLKDVVSVTSSSQIESPETSSEDLSHSHWNIGHTDIQQLIMDMKIKPSARGSVTDLKQVQISQPENLRVIKELVGRQQRCNIQRLQKDVRWLKRMEALLHAEQLKTENVGSPNYSWKNAQMQGPLTKSRRKLQRFVTKGGRRPPRSASIFVQLQSPLTSSIPADDNSSVMHLRSAGIQTSFTQGKQFVLQKALLKSHVVDSPVMSTPQTGTRTCARSQYGKQKNSYEHKISEGLPRPVAWFLPLNDDLVGTSDATSKELRTNHDKGSGLLNMAPPLKWKNSRRIFQEVFQQYKPGTNNSLKCGQVQKSNGKIESTNPSLLKNADIGVAEIQRGFRKYTVPVPYSSQHHNPNYRRLCHNEIRGQTEKIYKVLPEVTSKNELKRREDVYKTNWQMARMYRKNLQQKVLAGRVSLLTMDKCQR